MSSAEFLVRVASSLAEREAAYRLRYEFFTRELRDERYADHEAGHYCDRWDHENSPIVLAWTPSNEPIGTLRLAMRRFGSYLDDSLYRWDELASRVRLDEPSLLETVGIISRGGVAKAFRRRKVMSSMLDELELTARAAGISILIGAVEMSNSGSERWFEANGFGVYGVSRLLNRFQGDFYYKDLRVRSTQEEGRVE